MKNKELFAKEIVQMTLLDEVSWGVSKFDGKPRRCENIGCNKCLFQNNTKCMCEKCDEFKMKEWLNEEYVEPRIDWMNIRINTPVLVKDVGDEHYKKRYFAKYENGMVYTYNEGKTSWSADPDEKLIGWDIAKLAVDVMKENNNQNKEDVMWRVFKL